MANTTATLVKDLLGHNYDYNRNPSLTRYINAAYNVVLRMVACATDKSFTHTSSELTEIETWLAAHFYTKTDPRFASEGRGGASASYVTDPQIPEYYKAGAIEQDASGCLKSILSGQRAFGFWGGKPPSDQLDYDERD